jgi:MinD superfamily P-loop ATPase
MKEIVIISGKGGTGKTSITASFASLAAGKAVFADCDVDAADLHLVLKPSIKQKTEFTSGHLASIRKDECTRCEKCIGLCRFGAIKKRQKSTDLHIAVDSVTCEGCGVCVRFCPVKAIDFNEKVCGEWFISDTRFGPMVHAKLGTAAENSGKLVTLVRNEAKRIAKEKKAEYVLIDGSPGIGCPVIASLTAASLALIVTEPTVSGDHDLRRIAGLTKRLGIPAMVCVNKWDINPAKTEEIKDYSQMHGLTFAGLVRYGKTATIAQRTEKSIMEFPESTMASDIENVWVTINETLEKQK